MKGLPDSVVVGTITNAKRRAVQRQIAGRRANARIADNVAPIHYVMAVFVLLGYVLIGAAVL